VLKTEWQAILIGDANVGTQRLEDKHLPSPGEHFAPATFPISDVAFFVNIVKSSMRHQVVVPTTKIPFMKAAEEIPVYVSLGTARHVRMDRVSPGRNDFIEREGPVPVKPCVIA
jgi:hypothetical protein